MVVYSQGEFVRETESREKSYDCLLTCCSLVVGTNRLYLTVRPPTMLPITSLSAAA